MARSQLSECLLLKPGIRDSYPVMSNLISTVYFMEKSQIKKKSPGLVVMGADSCSKGCGFKSQHRIFDGHFSHLFVVIIVK